MPLTRVALIGPPASGKGTQCALLAEARGLLHLSTGHLIREEIERGTELGNHSREKIARGELLADGIVLELVRQRLQPRHWDHFLLDGFPRTRHQAEAFQQESVQRGGGLQRVILLEVPEDLLLERALNRATCPSCGHTQSVAGAAEPAKCSRCGHTLERRDDDNRESFAQRMASYHQQTGPLLEFYRQQGLVAAVDAGSSSVDEVTQRIAAVLDAASS